MNSIFRKALRALFLMREAYLLPRAGADRNVHAALASTAQARLEQRRGFQAYLCDHVPVSQIQITEDWHEAESGEMQLDYTNSLFAPGVLRLSRKGIGAGILIALPGFQTGASVILADRHHDHYLGDFASGNSLGLAAWDWPLQGRRLDTCMYQGLASIYSAEREYSRILPSLGTSLWREFIAEFEFALRQIRRLVGPDLPLHVIGWSMGGSFAYYAPLLGTAIATTIAAGSCAAISDLFLEHRARVHGFFFYPHDSLGYFDLDDIVAEVAAAGTQLLVIHGDQDPGCLPGTRQRLCDKIAKASDNAARLKVLGNHGHVLSDDLKNECSNFLTEFVQASDGSSSQMV